MKNKIEPKNTYDFCGLKVVVDRESAYCNMRGDTSEMKNHFANYNFKLQDKEVNIKIPAVLGFWHGRDDYGNCHYDFVSEEILFELISAYRYLKNNEINHEIADEIKSVIVPQKNLQNEIPPVTAEKLKEVYNKCVELGLTKEKITEIQKTLDDANEFCKNNNNRLQNRLDNKARIKKTFAKIGSVAFFPVKLVIAPIAVFLELDA